MIEAGDMDGAFIKDVDDIKSKFGDKYDEAILQAIDVLPSTPWW
jgi:hypothetical protein